MSFTFLGLLASLGRLHSHFSYIWAVRFGRTSLRLVLFISKPVFPLFLVLSSESHGHVFVRPWVSHPSFPPQQSQQCTWQEYSWSNRGTWSVSTKLKTKRKHSQTQKYRSHLQWMILGRLGCSMVKVFLWKWFRDQSEVDYTPYVGETHPFSWRP